MQDSGRSFPLDHHPLDSISFFFFLLYNIVLVLPYINMNPPLVYTCSQSWTPLPPPTPKQPSGSSQYTSPKHPVSCIEPGLVFGFLYDIIHVSMPFSQIIRPPSPTESKRLFYTSVSMRWILNETQISLLFLLYFFEETERKINIKTRIS